MLIVIDEQGEERRLAWRAEAEMLHARLDAIESLSRATHDSIIGHIAEERETKAAIDELILLWRGSKLVVSGFKILIPVCAALLGAAMWFKDHVKW
ncbi:hypothetical protein [Accumulibacter sp.]|uniref:hypothetical protein n=1 Tax=Accumulibacter sp. TaxID=2053492 RepID=UPI00331512FA